MHLPPFHTIGIMLQLFVPLAGPVTVALYPPTSLMDHNTPPAAPTTDTAMEHSKRTGVTAVLAVPSFLETWSLDAESVEWMKSLDFIVRAFSLLCFRILVADFDFDFVLCRHTEAVRLLAK